MRKIFIYLLMFVFAGSAIGQNDLQYKKQKGFEGTVNVEQIKFEQRNYDAKDVIWSDDLEDGSMADWTTYDEDGDGFNWSVASYASPVSTSCLTSASWDGTQGALTPENWAVTPAIDLSAVTDATFLDFNAWAQDQGWTSEHYKVMVSTTDNQVASFTDNVFEETLPGTGVFERTVSLSDYIGETIYLAFVHYDCTDMFMLNLDDFSVYTNTEVDLGITAAPAPSNDASCALTAAEDVTITLYNYGGVEASNFDVSYSINGAGTVTEQFTETIASGASADFTFSTAADLSAYDYYDLTFEVAMADDINPDNDTFTKEVRSTDGTLVVRAQSDAAGDQEWTITNSNDEVVASFLDYQWDVLVETQVCLLDDDCYTFEFTGFDETGWVELVYNGTVVAGGEVAGNTTGGVTWLGIGGGCASVDAKLDAITTPQYATAGNIDITGLIKNMGSDNITSFDVSYSIDGGAESSIYSVTGVDIATGNTYEFTHDVPYNFDAEGAYNIHVAVSNVNADEDANAENDTLNKQLTIVPFVPVKKVYGEEATGTWCQWCPRGHVYMDYMSENYPDTWIGVAVHNADPMVNTTYDNGIGSQIGGYPSGLVDRSGEFDPSEFESAYLDRINTIAPASVSIETISWDPATREISIEVSSQFIADLSNVRFNAVIAEDSVTGTTSGYAQSNAYSGGASGTMGGYENLPNPVPAADMVYMHVAREILGGWDGTDGSLPASIAAGETYSYTYDYTMPEDWDVNNLEFIGLLIDQNTGEIINANSTKGIQLPQTVTFNVTDGTDPLENAAIDINGEVLMTDGTGVATIDLFDGDYDYTISLAGYEQTSGTITVAGAAVTEDVTMIVPSTFYNVTFNISDNSGNPIESAVVNMTGYGEQTTDVDGVTVYNDVSNGTFNYTATATGYGEETGEVTVADADATVNIVINPLGLNQIEKIDFNIYPNPSKGIFHVKTKGTAQLTIINAVGQIIKTQEINGEATINLADNGAGIYFIRLQSENSIGTKRIIVE